MKIHYLQAECGAGKTYQALADIAAHPGRYVFAVNKIDLIRERLQEFRQLPGAERDAVYQLHSDYPVLAGLSVGQQIQLFTSQIPPHARAVLLFVTHEGLRVADWAGYRDWRLIIDEVPAAWGYLEKNFSQSAAFVRPLFRAEPYPRLPGYLRLSLTRQGRELRNGWAGDDIVQVIKGVLDACEKRSVVLIGARAWENLGAGKFRAATLFEPEHLAAFRSVTILGNRFTASLLHRCWAKIGVEFEPVPLTSGRAPAVPIGERLEVIYFSRRDATFNYFRSPENPLARVAEWCRKRLGREDLYYTVNQEFLGSFLFPGQERLAVLAHGHNRLRHKRVGIFMAALKGKPQEYALIQEAFGVSRAEFDRARECEALWQFVMRSNLRDYGGRAKVYMYVFSRAQAEFLRAATGALIRHEDIGLNDEVNRGGRPRLGAEPDVNVKRAA
jgi:hypothetical protein